MVKQYASLTGNCFRLKIDYLELPEGRMVMRGMKKKNVDFPSSFALVLRGMLYSKLAEEPYPFAHAARSARSTEARKRAARAKG